MSEQGKSLNDLGLYGLIEHVNQKVAETQEKAAGPDSGDDAAALTENPEILQAGTLLLEGIHFDLTYTPLQHLGFKAVTIAISDLLAMNARPVQLSLNLGISQKINLDMIDQFVEGLLAACTLYGVRLAGFKPGPSLTGFTIALQATGKAAPGEQVLRSTARENEVLLVSGDLGGALMGLHLLEREKRVLKDNQESQPDFGNNDYVLQRQLKPMARTTVVEKLRQLGLKPGAMTVVTEGLATATRLLCKASHKGCRLHEEKIPLHQSTLKAAAELNYNPLIAALNGGEDYELLLTLPAKDFEKNREALEEVLHPIGYITAPEKACRMISRSGEEIDLKARGWGNNQ